jgi:hypothetical protein
VDLHPTAGQRYGLSHRGWFTGGVGLGLRPKVLVGWLWERSIVRAKSIPMPSNENAGRSKCESNRERSEQSKRQRRKINMEVQLFWVDGSARRRSARVIWLQAAGCSHFSGKLVPGAAAQMHDGTRQNTAEQRNNEEPRGREGH